MGTTISDYYIMAAGRRIRVRRIQPDVPMTEELSLVFLHEGLGSIEKWRDYPLRLSEKTGLTTIVYDRWGHGGSDPFTLPRGIEHLHDEALISFPEVMEACGISSAVLIGHSDGGSIALICASAFPDCVRAVITEAAHVFVEDVTLAGIREALAAYRSTDLRSRLVRYHGGKTDTVFRGWSETWLSESFRKWNIERFLPGVRCPVLVIQGRNDRYGTLAQVQAIATQVSGPATALLLDCGHIPHAEAGDHTLEEMVHFIGNVIASK